MPLLFCSLAVQLFSAAVDKVRGFRRVSFDKLRKLLKVAAWSRFAEDAESEKFN